MRKISSEGATVSAKTFSVLGGVVMAFMLCALTYECLFGKSRPIEPILMLAILLAYAWLIRTTVWSLMDEVSDGGDYLVVKRGVIEDNLYFADIEDAVEKAFSRPPTLVIQLRCKSSFGWKVEFVPTTNKDVLDGGMSIGREVRHRSRVARNA